MDDLIKKEMAGTPTVQQAEKLYNIRNVENFTHNEIHMPDVAFQSHAADWALLNTEFYNLFVLQNENFKDGSFSLSTDVALKNTERELKRSSIPLVRIFFYACRASSLCEIQVIRQLLATIWRT